MRLTPGRVIYVRHIYSVKMLGHLSTALRCFDAPPWIALSIHCTSSSPCASSSYFSLSFSAFRSMEMQPRLQGSNPPLLAKRFLHFVASWSLLNHRHVAVWQDGVGPSPLVWHEAHRTTPAQDRTRTYSLFKKRKKERRRGTSESNVYTFNFRFWFGGGGFIVTCQYIRTWDTWEKQFVKKSQQLCWLLSSAHGASRWWFHWHRFRLFLGDCAHASWYCPLRWGWLADAAWPKLWNQIKIFHTVFQCLPTKRKTPLLCRFKTMSIPM